MKKVIFFLCLIYVIQFAQCFGFQYQLHLHEIDMREGVRQAEQESYQELYALEQQLKQEEQKK